MSRQIQIRRGTAVEHAVFTGAVGEITMDTDANTARLHDGTLLGGHALARADLSNISVADFKTALAGAGIKCDDIGNEFDINAVPTGFWTALFQQYAPAPALSKHAKSLSKKHKLLSNLRTYVRLLCYNKLWRLL